MKVHVARLVCGAFLLLGAANISRAQFSAAFLQNDSYWGGGKAEIDFYDAQVMRDGQLRHGELQMIVTKTTAPVPTEGPSTSPSPTVPVIRMSQSMTIARGLTSEERASAVHLLTNGTLFLAQEIASLADHIVFSRADLLAETKGIAIEQSDHPEKVEFLFAKEAPIVLRSELPLRVRLLDLSKSAGGEFDVRLIDAQPRSDAATEMAAPAKVSYKMSERAIEVEVRQGKETNNFTVDREFPFLLRAWKTADGSTYKLKNSLKADPSKYTKEGDREKALKDPMLRHPD